MPDIAQLTLWPTIAVFVTAGAIIAFAGSKLSVVADKLADRTGMGEVVAGALFVGAATSLPGAITSMTTAAEGAAGLAVGNALGGLTAQTAFIAIADLFYRRANLEHAAASATGLAQGVLLVALLSIPLIASGQPPITLWHVHPVSILIPIAYGFGLVLLSQIQSDPLWKPIQTPETREETSEPVAEKEEPDHTLWFRFLLFAGMTAISGYVIGEASIVIVDRTPLSETAVGTVFSAIANSLPELVTAIAAVRIGAVSLAVGDVIGGNAFEVMFLSAADFFYDGSIYEAISDQDRTTGLMAILMTAVLLLGMIRRQQSGPGNIGFESSLVLGLYLCSVIMILI